MSHSQAVYKTFARAEPVFVRGEGVRLFDDVGMDYYDCTSGIAVNALGYSHPHLVEALKGAADGIWHLSNIFKIPEQERLAERLCEATFADRVFFTNSGGEALECAIKTARRYFYDKGQPDRYNIITFEGAFHGRTLGTIAAGGQEKYMEGFGPKAPGFIQVAFGDHDALHAAIDENTAAFLIEPIQGEGGVRSVPNQCLRGLREICDEKGILLIYDEVQTGVGRTGELFHYQKSGAAPDIMAIAKGIGAGFPVGACLATEAAADAMVVGTHGTTFGGNPLAMAVGNAVLDVVLEDGFMEHIQQMELVLRQQLAEMVDTFPDLLEGVCGEGLMQGLKAKVTNTDLIAEFRKHGLLTVAAGHNVIRVYPPLIVTEEELREIKSRMRSALEAYSHEQA